MAKTDTGKFKLLAFDDLGRRDKRFDADDDTMSGCQDQGWALQAKGEIDSFKIVRVLFNSKDQARARWEPKSGI